LSMVKSISAPMTQQQQTALMINQHNSLDQFQPRHKVFLQRDYSRGTGVRYLSAFPSELEGFVERETFNYLVDTINLIFEEGERMSGRAFCESCCACLSAYLLYLCMESLYDRCLKRVSSFVAEQNDTKWKPLGMLVTDPRDRGLRVIEITIFTDKAQRRALPLQDAVANTNNSANTTSLQPLRGLNHHGTTYSLTPV